MGSLVGGLIVAVILITLLVQYRRRSKVLDVKDESVADHKDHEIVKDEPKINKEDYSKMMIMD